MIKAILFDSDGVLADSERLFFEITSDVFASNGIPITREQWARWYLGGGKRSRDIAVTLGLEPSAARTMIEKRDELFAGLIEKGVSLFPGVQSALNRLAVNFRLAVVTGASRRHYDRVHSSTGLKGFFEVIVTSDDCEQVKPHPQAYLLALQKLGLEPGECVAVEDSPRGAAAAMAAGIRCFVIPTSLTDLSLCPPCCTILRDITKLEETLLG